MSEQDGREVKHDDPTKRVYIPAESGTGTCYHAIGGCGGHLVNSTEATAEELVTGLGLRPCQAAACLNANILEYDRCDGCAKPVFGAEPHPDGVGRYCPACRAFLDEHPSPNHDQYELREPSKLVADGGEEVGRGTSHVLIDVPPGGRDAAKEALDYRVGPACNWEFFREPEDWRGRQPLHIVLWGDTLDQSTLRSLSEACHDQEQEHSDMAMYDAAEDADRMESAFLSGEEVFHDDGE